MKMYSSNVVTKEEVAAVAAKEAQAAMSAVDLKQSEQIMKLRTAIAVSFLINLTVAIGAYFF